MMTREPNTLPEAMAALSDVVELERWEDFEALYGGDRRNELVLPWLEGQEPSQALATVRKIFRIILDHLHYLDRQARDDVERARIFHGIRAMMMTVGEAAHKLDRLATLMYGLPDHSVTDLREFQELERFYRSKVMNAPPSSEALPTELASMEQLKRDDDYELFHMRHEHGQSFVSKELRENMKLASDFGILKQKYVADDPLVGVREWHDKRQQETAKQIVRMTRGVREKFYREMPLETENRMVGSLHKALMALVMAADPHNLLVKGPYKPCFEYFDDFIGYLDEALSSDDYKLVLAAPDEGFHVLLLDLVAKVCTALYTHMAADQQLIDTIHQIFEEEGRRAGARSFTDHIRRDYDALVKALGRHPSGPLFKGFDILLENEFKPWDPLRLENIPSKLFSWRAESQTVEVLRLPSPTTQEYVHRADVSEEYKAFLRASEGTHLLINLQDRNSWKEGARAVALEELPQQAEFADKLTVATLSVEADFYTQRGAFRNMSNTEQFLTHFYEHLESPHLGYHFPPALRGKLFPRLVHEILDTVHGLFFDGKPRLSRRERCIFVEIVHVLLILRLVEDVEPRYLALVCKDGVDTSMALTAALDGCLKILQERHYTKIDERHMWQILFLPALLMRERPMLTARMRRLLDILQHVEDKAQSMIRNGQRHLLHEQLGHIISILKR